MKTKKISTILLDQNVTVSDNTKKKKKVKKFAGATGKICTIYLSGGKIHYDILFPDGRILEKASPKIFKLKQTT